jgi:hypothetical protein
LGTGLVVAVERLTVPVEIAALLGAGVLRLALVSGIVIRFWNIGGHGFSVAVAAQPTGAEGPKNRHESAG